MKLKLCKHTSLSKPKRERPFLYVVDVVFFLAFEFYILFLSRECYFFSGGAYLLRLLTPLEPHQKYVSYIIWVCSIIPFWRWTAALLRADIILLIVWLAFLNYSALAQHWERRHNTHKRRGSRWEIATNWTIKKRKCLLKERAPVLLLLLLFLSCLDWK